jgi:hypothetical protein
MADLSQIREGGSIFCEACQSKSIAQLEKEYEGFTVKRQYLLCALCRAELVQNKAAQSEVKPSQKKPASALADLFAVSEDKDSKSFSALLADDNVRRFCKDCKYNFITAFKCFCELHKKEVEPLSDCSDFVKKVVKG